MNYLLLCRLSSLFRIRNLVLNLTPNRAENCGKIPKSSIAKSCFHISFYIFEVFFHTVTCVSCRVQNKLHRMTTEWKQNCLTLHPVWEREKRNQKKKTTRAAQTLNYYKYAKLMTIVETRMLTHTQKWPSTCLPHQNPDISQQI